MSNTTSHMEYTYEEYKNIISSINDSDSKFGSYNDKDQDNVVILRHDVDWSPKKAKIMAEIESNHGVQSTYFFLLTSPFYNSFERSVRKKIKEIDKMGHDVGLHFSTHQYWSSEPQPGELVAAVHREQRVLSELVDNPASAVSFHIPPEWILSRKFESFISAYEPQFFKKFTYLADSNQRWRDDPPLGEIVPSRLQMLVHPGLWGESDATFVERLTREREERFKTVREFLDEQFVSQSL